MPIFSIFKSILLFKKIPAYTGTIKEIKNLDQIILRTYHYPLPAHRQARCCNLH